MPLPLTVSCFIKIQTGLPFWYLLTRIVPGKGPLNVCLCLLVSMTDMWHCSVKSHASCCCRCRGYVESWLSLSLCVCLYFWRENLKYSVCYTRAVIGLLFSSWWSKSCKMRSSVITEQDPLCHSNYSVKSTEENSRLLIAESPTNRVLIWLTSNVENTASVKVFMRC